MADVFISYSRKDREFVKRLFDALEAQRRDLWVDWEDIEYAADWWEKICGGIEGADNFVFVLTPDSAESAVCRDEIQHAVDHHKRIIPILHKEITNEAQRANLHPAIHRHNWLPFLAESDFEQSIANLIETIDKDPEHVQQHTRLLVRAIEWDNRKRPNSLLLRGDDLTQAESWLTDAVGKDPAPTALQAEYINASRIVARRAQRNLLAGVSIALVVTLAAAVIAAVQFTVAQRESNNRATQQSLAELALSTSEARGTAVALERERADGNAATAIFNADLAATNEAEAFAQATAVAQQRDRADGNAATAIFNADLAATNEAEAFARATAVAQQRDRADANAATAVFNADLALSRQLSAQSNSLLDANPGLAMLLAMEGLNLRDDSETRDGVLRAMGHAPQLQTFLRGHQEHVTTLALSPDGRLLASGDLNGKIILWDTQTWQRLNPIIDVTFAISGLYFPDNRRLMFGTGNRGLQVIDIKSRAIVATPRSGSLNPNELQFGGEDRAIFSPEGSKVIIATVLGGMVSVYDTANGQLVNSIILDEQGIIDANDIIDDMAIDAGAGIALIGTSGKVVLWDYVGGSAKVVGEGTQSFSSVDITSDGTQMAWYTSDSEDGRVTAHIWDVVTRSALTDFPVQNVSGVDVHWLTFNEDGRLLLFATGDGELFVVDADTGRQVMPPVVGHSDWILAMMSGPNSMAFTAGRDNKIVVWDVDALAALAQPFLPEISDQIRALDLSGDQRALAIASPQTLQIRRFPEGETLITPFSPYDGEIRRVIYHPRQPLIVTVNQGIPTLMRWWDVSGEIAVMIAEQSLDEIVQALSFMPDGRFLFGGGGNNMIYVWDGATGELLNQQDNFMVGIMLEVERLGAVVQALKVSPDGTLLATTGVANNVALWRIGERGDLTPYEHSLLPIPADASGISPWELTFSADGQLLAAAFLDGSIIIWHVETGELATRELPGTDVFTLAMAFNPNGSVLAVGGQDNWLRLWDVNTGRLLGVPLISNQIQDMAFLADGSALLTGGEAGLLLWPMSTQSWQTVICERTALNLSPGDWARFVAGQPYHLTCPEVALRNADQFALDGDAAAAAESFGLLVTQVTAEDDADFSDAVCRYGALDLQAAVVRPACDRAVELGPENGYYYDSRAIARTLTGDVEGALADFGEFITWARDNDLDIEANARENWEVALEAGESPLSQDVRAALRVEFTTRFPTLVNRSAEVPVLEAERQTASDALTAEEYEEALATAAMPFEPLMSSDVNVSGWYLSGAGRIESKDLGEFSDILLTGTDGIGFRFERANSQVFIAVFQSNGPYTTLEEWTTSSPMFEMFRLVAHTDMIEIGGVEVMRADAGDFLQYFFIYDNLQISIISDELDRSVPEALIAALIALR